MLERTHERFVRAGALLDADAQAELRQLNSEESSLTTAFSNKLLAATARPPCWSRTAPGWTA